MARIAYLQFAPTLGQPANTLARLSPLLNEAREADLLVLPELCNSGYNFPDRGMAEATAESIPEGPFTQFLIEQAQRNQQYIVAGVNEKSHGKLYNSSVLVGPEGYLGTYRKLHLFKDEKDLFEPGDLGLPVFETKLGKIGMLICFDWMFPEAWRALALQGAEVIAHPSNLVLPGFAQRAVPVHALINRYFVVTANRIGTEGELTFTGMSTIANPKGEVLSQAPAAATQIAQVEVDLSDAHDKMITPRNHALHDRREDVYGERRIG
jgi:predicted amidohydrolase